MAESKNIIEKINHFLEKSNCSDFRIKSFDGFKLHLIGSFDLCYYHEVEIVFNGVYKISMEIDFFVDCDKKPFQFHKADKANADCDNEMIKIIILDGTNTKQSIICQDIDLIVGRVKYYDNTGNRIL